MTGLAWGWSLPAAFATRTADDFGLGGTERSIHVTTRLT